MQGWGAGVGAGAGAGRSRVFLEKKSKKAGAEAFWKKSQEPELEPLIN